MSLFIAYIILGHSVITFFVRLYAITVQAVLLTDISITCIDSLNVIPSYHFIDNAYLWNRRQYFDASLYTVSQ